MNRVPKRGGGGEGGLGGRGKELKPVLFGVGGGGRDGAGKVGGGGEGEGDTHPRPPIELQNWHAGSYSCVVDTKRRMYKETEGGKKTALWCMKK